MTSVILASILLSVPASAGEGTAQLGESQVLRPSLTELRVDVLAGGETITWAGTSDDGFGGSVPVSCDVYDPTGAILVGTVPDGGSVVANQGKGAYLLDCGEDFRGSDECCDPGSSDFDAACCAAPDGVVEDLVAWDVGVLAAAADRGRVWSAEWWFDAGTFTVAGALDGSFFVLVDGGSPANDGVVELRVDGLAGFLYTVGSNGVGVVDADGRSVLDVGARRFDESHAVYLQPPAVAGFDPLVPAISADIFAPEDPQCGAVAPGIPGYGGAFTFTSATSGTWHITCDLDQDGTFRYADDSDIHLLGAAVAGVNSVVWDGLDNVGAPVPAGSYACRVDLTVGEMHYPARDVETAYEGIRLYAVDAALVRTGLPMWWNDAEVQVNEDDAMPNGEVSAVLSPAFGLDPGAYGDAPLPSSDDVVGTSRAWGDFDATSKGNNAWLDTWSFLAVSEGQELAIDVLDSTLDSDGDGVGDVTEACGLGTDPNLADTDADGLDDGIEAALAYDPLDPDMDADGLLDGAETDGSLGRDTDADGLDDALDPDDDGDGILTKAELAFDTDSDGLTNHRDADDDGDGVPTAIEGPTTNSDTDATVDYLDDDDDGDGLFTIVEDRDGIPGAASDDTDGDGLADYQDPDDDGDSVRTADELAVPNVDGDALPSFLDPDDDGDGVLTLAEDVGGNGIATDDDSDGDGAANWLDDDDDGDGILTSAEDWDDSGTATDDDVDADGLPDFADLDDDGDGLLSVDEDIEFPNGDLLDDDHDADGVPDFRDADDDDDGLPTLNETGDFDSDGIPDAYDPDDDEDGLPTSIEGQEDGDGDGFGNWHDPDSDGDGYADGPEGAIDTDGDLLLDFEDADDDGDGVLTADELDADSDGDGDPDPLDADDDDDGLPTLDEGAGDPDGDGIPSYLDDDSDGDTLSDAVEGLDDVDRDGLGNALDVDSDADGFDDGLEGVADTDGDGMEDRVDADDDGDTVDSVREPGDTDGDGVPDRLDTDDDGDGIPTATEALDAATWGEDPDGDDLAAWVDPDADGDGLADAEEGADADSDGDGAPDYLDADILGSWYKGGGACTTTGGSPLGVFATLIAALLLRRRNVAVVVAAALAGPALAAGDGAEIARSRGIRGGGLVLWPRVVSPAADPQLEDLAAKLQARLQQIAGRVLPPEKVQVRPAPERACPMDGGCRAASVGVLLGAEGGGCVAVAWITPAGDEGATTLVPWGGTVELARTSLAFREAPEGVVTVREYVPCAELLTRLDDAAVQGALQAAIGLLPR